MGASAGPDIIEDGLVLSLDAADLNSLKGGADTNLLYNISNTYGTTDQTYFKVSYGDIEELIPELGYRTVRYCNIFNDYSGGSGQCCPSPLRYGGNVLGQNITVSPSTTYTYQIIYKVKSGYTNANYMYRYEYNGGTYVTEGGVHSTNNRTSLGNDWWFAWGQFTTQSTTNNLWLAGMWYYQYNVYDTIYVAGVSLHQGSHIIPAKFMLGPQENRGTTVATGGGWADLTGNENHGQLVNGVRESGDNRGVLVFDGVNDYIQSAAFSDQLTADITVEAWIYLTAPASDWVRIIGTGGNNGNRTFGLWYSTSRTLLWQRYGAGDPSIQPSNVLATGTWYHVSAITSGSSHTIYLNGNQIGSASGTGPWAASGENITIGFAGFHTYHNGRIANAKIYNKALTPQEIQQNFNMLRGRFGI